MRVRFGLAVLFVLLLGMAYFFGRRAESVRAAPENEPGAYWRIGKLDGLADEFAPGAARELSYEIGKSRPRDWRERQDASPQNPSIYKVKFALEAAPAPATLAIDCYFLADASAGIEVNVNGKRGYYRIVPSYAHGLGERQANDVNYSKQSLRAPLPAGLLHAGANEIAISAVGEHGSIRYDSVALLKSAPPAAALSAAIEPSIFFRRVNGVVKEVVNLVLHHQKPLSAVAVSLRVNEAVASRKAPGNGYDFGEQLIELEIAAPASTVSYELAVDADGEKLRDKGEFRPEKRWRLFAGLKIHNDIGYTDLQPNVQELDSRNTDGVLDILSRFPFYKFNLEDGWLVDNYAHSRRPERMKRLMEYAARGRVGISAMYLNLLTGLCTGEELYRALYYTKGLEKKYGVPVKSACLTDAPSHTWFVPTLLRDAGVSSFANGSNQTRAPLLGNSRLNEDSPFYWEGIDGARVLTWFSRSYLQFERLAGTPPTIERLRRTIPQFLARYRRGDYPVDAVMVYGLYTDNADIRTGAADIFGKWNETYEFPKIIPATDADYFAYVSERFADRLPVFRGDAGSYWEDGAGSSAAETALNRDTQRMLPAAEAISAIATAFHPAELYPAHEFREAWKNTLFYDEHTWGASRSTREPERKLVTDQWNVKRGFAVRAHDAAEDLLTRSMSRLVQNISTGGPTLFVFNTAAETRTDVVPVELGVTQQPVDLATGKPVALDVVERRTGYRVARFIAENVPGFGYKAYAVRNAPAAETAKPEAAAWQIESRWYRLELDSRTGAIRQIYDKTLARDLVDDAALYRLNELLYVTGGENTRLVRDDTNLPPAEIAIEGQQGAEIVSRERTPAGERIRIRARARSVPEIETEISVYDGIRRIDIVNRIRKEAVREKEAVYFAFPFRSARPELAYQIQNGWVRPNADQLPGACREWFTTQNAVVARDGDTAVVWSSPDAPLIALTDINRGWWLKNLDIKNAHVFSYAMNNYWFTNYKASQSGNHVFRYFISSGRTLGEAELARFSAATRSPLIAYDYYNTGNVRNVAAERRMPAAQGAFFKVGGCKAEITAFKQAEDGNGFILRLRDAAGEPGACRVESPVFPLLAAYRTNGVEQNLAPARVHKGGVDVKVKSHGYGTVRLILGRAGE